MSNAQKEEGHQKAEFTHLVLVLLVAPYDNKAKISTFYENDKIHNVVICIQNKKLAKKYKSFIIYIHLF